MYRQFKNISGVWFYRTTPNGEWRICSDEEAKLLNEDAKETSHD